MSKAEIERFVSDLKSNPELLAKVQEGAAGVGSVVQIAKDSGYDISPDEAKEYIQEQAGKSLSDDQLDAVAGGKGGSSTSTVTQVAAVQTEAVATTTTAEAEVEAEAVAVVVLT